MKTKQVNNLIRKIRIKNGLSQDQVARDLNVSSNYISLLENGRKNPGTSFLNDFSKRYKIPLILLYENMIPTPSTKKEEDLKNQFLKIVEEFEKIIFK